MIQITSPAYLHESKEIDISKNDRESTKETLDINTTIGEGIIWRSKIEGNNNWSEIVATYISGFKQNLGIGETLQLIPLRKELSIIEFEVIKTKKTDDFNDGTNN